MNTDRRIWRSAAVVAAAVLVMSSGCFTTRTGTTPAFSKSWTNDIQRHKSDEAPESPTRLHITDKDSPVDVSVNGREVSFRYGGNWGSGNRTPK